MSPFTSIRSYDPSLEARDVLNDATRPINLILDHVAGVECGIVHCSQGHVSRYARQAHGALQGVEEPNEVIGIIAAFMQDSYEGAGVRTSVLLRCFCICRPCLHACLQSG